MIYEFRTYTLKPRSLAEVEKRHASSTHGKLSTYWRATETLSQGR